ncbi:MAG: cob(I)yrinic acid a,c-diamide adenosyltransferase [Desulfobacterales bacterium]
MFRYIRETAKAKPAALGLYAGSRRGTSDIYCPVHETGDFSELKALARFDDLITAEQFGTGKFVMDPPGDADLAAAGKGLEAARAALSSGRYDMVIMEEAAVAAAMGLVSTDEILDIIRTRPEKTELVITGRNAPDALIATADLTEMREIKHYYQAELAARRG